MERTVLTNAYCAQLAPLFPKCGPVQHLCKRPEGILWVHRTDVPWRDVLRCFGHWESVESCFARWSNSGLWTRIWEMLRTRLGEDHKALYLDSTSIKAHRHSTGARGRGEEAIGCSRGGRGTQGPRGVRRPWLPLGRAADGGTSAQCHPSGRLARSPRGRADRGCDSDALREIIKAKGAEPVIPGRKVSVEYDKYCYGSRHVIENFFCRIKDHRRVATRYEKTSVQFAVMVML